MSFDPAADDDEHYVSEEDPDFAPDAVPDAPASSDDEGRGDDSDNDNNRDTNGGGTASTRPATTKRKRQGGDGGNDEADDVGFENSGDEAVISKGLKKSRRKKNYEAGDDDNDGGIGGFVKTRSQRANEKAEHHVAKVEGPVTVDVDALWAEMIGTGAGTTVQPTLDSSGGGKTLASLATAAMAAVRGDGEEASAATAGAPAATLDAGTKDGQSAISVVSSRLVKIKRTYRFAGQVHLEEKLVARDSAEAKLYTEETGEEPEAVDDDKGLEAVNGEDAGTTLKTPPRKAFRSAFEPVLDIALLQNGRRADLELGLQARLLARAQAQGGAAAAARKLNTVEKSRMDWAGFVDREGIQDELALAGKSKGAFVNRQQFLARTDMLREEEARRARLAGKV